MIATATIQAALVTYLQGLEAPVDVPLFERVVAHADADLSAALENLRENPCKLAVVVPGSDDVRHVIEEGTNTPIYAEIRNTFELLLTDRELDGRATGAPNVLPMKDTALAALMWDDLGVEGLITLPQLGEPLTIEFEDRRSGATTGREAWKLTLEIRQIITL